jgi:hypothetical protein
MIPLLAARAKALLIVDDLRDDNLNTQETALVLLMAMAMAIAHHDDGTREAFCDTTGPALRELSDEYARDYGPEPHGVRRKK